MQFLFHLNHKKAYAAQSTKAKPPAIAAKHDNPVDWANQRANGGHGKAGAPKGPTKGGHGVKIVSVIKDNLEDDEIESISARKLALLRALAAAAVRGKVGTRHRDGGAGMRPDDDIAAAA